MAQVIQSQPLVAKTPRWRSVLKGFSLGEAGIYYALALVLIVLTVLTRVFESQNFLDPGNLANILYQASFVAIIAVPMTLVLISGNFDLSVAATAAISAACVLLLSDQVGIFPAMAISLVPGLLAGLHQCRRRARSGHQCLHCDAGHDDGVARRSSDHHRRSHRLRR